MSELDGGALLYIIPIKTVKDWSSEYFRQMRERSDFLLRCFFKLVRIHRVTSTCLLWISSDTLTDVICMQSECGEPSEAFIWWNLEGGLGLMSELEYLLLMVEARQQHHAGQPLCSAGQASSLFFYWVLSLISLMFKGATWTNTPTYWIHNQGSILLNIWV